MATTRTAEWMCTVAAVLAVAGTALAVIPDGFLLINERFLLPKTAALCLGALVGGVGLSWSGVAVAPAAGRYTIAAAVYLAAGALATAHAGGPWPPFFEWSLLAVAALVVVNATAVAARNPDGRELILAALVAVAAVMACSCFAEALGYETPWGGARRPVATVGNRNFVAAFVGIAAPIAVARAWSKKGVGQLAVAALLVGAIVLTRCRSIWLALLLVGAVGGVRALGLRGDERRVAGRLAAVVLATVALVAMAPWRGLRWHEAAPFAASARRLVAYDEGSGRVRVLQHVVGASAFVEHPLVGAGPGSWGDVAARFAARIDARPTAFEISPVPHSEPLRVLVETGVCGLLAAAAAIAMLLTAGLRACRDHRSDPMPIALVASLVVAAINGLLDAPLHRLHTLAELAVVAGVLLSWAPAPQETAPRSSRFVPAAAGVGATLFAVALLVAGFAAGRRTAAGVRLAQRVLPRLEIAQMAITGGIAAADPSLFTHEAQRLRDWAPDTWGGWILLAADARDRGDEALAANLIATARRVRPGLDDAAIGAMMRLRDVRPTLGAR